MKRVYFTLALMSLFGGLNAFAQSYTTIDGVKYGLMKDGQCVVIGDDGAKGDITFENEVEIDGIKYPVQLYVDLGIILLRQPTRRKVSVKIPI